MKQLAFFLSVAALAFFSFTAQAQQSAKFEGSFYTTANNQPITMQIAPYADGIAGQVQMGAETAGFVGSLEGNESYGLMQDANGDMSAYHAVLNGNSLLFTITMIDPATFKTTEATLQFKRGTPTTTAATKPQLTQAAVTSGAAVQGSNSATAREWRSRLADTRLTYMSSYSSGYGDSYGGYSVQRAMDLCNKGYFTYAGSSSFSANAPGASAYNAGNSGGDGTWVIVDGGSGTAVLQLHFNNGETARYTLGMQDGKTYLNGERWFRITKAEGGEYAPTSCY